ncbi:MAG: UvrD-helicase domain-containing protein [Negativicutes bacterium]|jgi:DNA helicase-2/ATP-dependent DNA helicase PcrA
MQQENQKTDLAQEQKYFDEVLEVVRRQGEELEIIVNKRISIDSHHEIALHRVSSQNNTRQLKKLTAAFSEPYFARMDYHDEEKQRETIYIGKVMQIEEGDRYYVTDWRKPIANLFYSKHLRGVSLGEKQVSVELKRRFDISDSRFLGYNDVFDAAISEEHYDENLAALLKRNAGTHLKDIISTIQENQNTIIRRPLNTSIKIQGVAGSGKTSVVLHRLSYLLYDGKLNVEDCLLVLPNPIFRNYLAKIIPELEIERIAAMTTTEIASSVWDELWAIKPRFEIYDYELEVINHNVAPDKDYLEGYKYFNGKKAIDDIIKAYNYFVTTTLTSYLALLARVAASIQLERALQILLERLGGRLEKLIDAVCIGRFNNISRLAYQQFLVDLRAELAELRADYQATLSQYARDTGGTNVELLAIDELERARKNLEIRDVTKLYRQLLNSIKVTQPQHERYIKYKDYNLNRRRLAREDTQLCAVLALSLFSDCKWYRRYENIVIDEVQDISELEMYLLCLMSKNQLFTIAGDENQGIFNYRNANEWRGLDYIRDHFSLSYVEPHILNKCYRSTAAITRVCNAIAGTAIEAVFDNNEQVDFCRLPDEQSIGAKILEYVEKYRAKGCKTIAIIPKYKSESDTLYLELIKPGGPPEINYIKGTQDRFVEGVTLVSTPNAKGLEFDAVIISNASAKNYDSNDSIDRRLLYVAASRALSNLAIISRGDPTECLTEFFA